MVSVLHRFLEKRIQLREHVEVLELRVDAGRVLGVKTRQGEIQADRVIVCTGAWTAKLLEQLGTRPDIQPVRGQMILFYAKPGQINTVALYRERYVIPRKDGRVKHFKDVTVAGFEGAGHWVHHDKLDAFVELVADFLAD